MKCKLFFLTVLLLTLQQNILSSSALTYDSVMIKLSDHSLSLDDSYAYVRVVDHLSFEEQIAITEEVRNIVLEANEEDKAKLITLCAMLDNLYTKVNNMEKRKESITEGLKYVDQTVNVDALGGIYYRAGCLYWDEDDMVAAHKLFYKAIACYEKSETKKAMLSFIYYKLGTYFLNTKDTENLGKLVDKMLTVRFEGEQRIYYNNIYSFASSYYSNMAARKDENVQVYIDSTLYYLYKSLDIFNEFYDSSKSQSVGALRMASQNYFSVADILLDKRPVDFRAVDENISKGEKLMIANDTASLKKLYNVKGNYLFEKKKYQDALTEYLRVETLMANQAVEPHSHYTERLFNQMKIAYEKTGNYQQALKYSQLADSVREESRNEKRLEILNELSTKYETAQKDLKISNLTQEKQKARFNTWLIIGFSVIVIILVSIGLLYNRLMRLKKEKEAAELSRRVEQKEQELKLVHQETEKRMLRQYLDGKESERKALAKELHDSVANEIISIIMLNQTQSNSEKMDDMLKDTYNNIRQISHQLMPPEFKYISLVGMIEDYIGMLNNISVIHFELVVEDADILPITEDMPEELSKEIYYIIQEAIGNILKHSEATEAFIKLSLSGQNMLEIYISDNGKGFNPMDTTKGIGLRTMKDRSSAISGRLNIDSELGEGTKIALSICIKEELLFQ